jgi:hypothetical protein
LSALPSVELSRNWNQLKKIDPKLCRWCIEILFVFHHGGVGNGEEATLVRAFLLPSGQFSNELVLG